MTEPLCHCVARRIASARVRDWDKKTPRVGPVWWTGGISLSVEGERDYAHVGRMSTGSNDARCSELFDSSKGVTDV